MVRGPKFINFVLLKNEAMATDTIEHQKKAFNDLYQYHDYYGVDDLLTDEHKLIRDTVRSLVKKEVTHIIDENAQRAEFPKRLIKGLGEIGAFGPHIPTEYGGGGLDEISYGIIMQELERGDSGIRSTASVQGSLVMYPIYAYGTEEQRKKYLPKLATGELMGCFGLTEPDHGSNPGGMVSNIKDKGDHYLLNGAKMWISNAPIADVFVVWAKSEAHNNEIRGFVLEKGMKGLSAPKIGGKLSLRASITGEIVMDGVEVGEDALLQNKLMQFEVELMALEFTALRLLSAHQQSKTPGVEASMLKVRGTELRQAIYETLVDIAGPDAVPFSLAAQELEHLDQAFTVDDLAARGRRAQARHREAGRAGEDDPQRHVRPRRAAAWRASCGPARA